MHYDIEHTSVYYAARENAEIARFLRANGRYRRFNAGAGSGIVIRVTGNDSLLNTSTYCTEQYYSETPSYRGGMSYSEIMLAPDQPFRPHPLDAKNFASIEDAERKAVELREKFSHLSENMRDFLHVKATSLSFEVVNLKMWKQDVSVQPWRSLAVADLAECMKALDYVENMSVDDFEMKFQYANQQEICQTLTHFYHAFLNIAIRGGFSGFDRHYKVRARYGSYQRMNDIPRFDDE